MTNQHPATPTAQEIDKFFMLPLGEEERLAAAFCAGADQELDACVKWVEANAPGYFKTHELLRAARRPKPPSLKKQALSEVVAAVAGGNITPERGATIRLALEALPDD
jgi:hypothetical protein